LSPELHHLIQNLNWLKFDANHVIRSVHVASISYANKYHISRNELNHII